MHLVLLGLNEEFNILSMNITMKQFHQPVFRSLALPPRSAVSIVWSGQRPSDFKMPKLQSIIFLYV